MLSCLQCGHCKKMKASWEKLAEEWADHEVGLVAEVDCTDEGKPLCEVNGVRGYPTIKYGDPEDLDDYEGGRNFEELSKFAKENLKPLCSPKNLEQCDDDTKKLFDEYMTMPLEKLEEKITELEQELLDAENSFREETGKLKDAYQKLTEEKEAKLAAVNNAGLRVLKSIKNFMRQSAKDEL